MINKPFAESCEQNKLPILNVIRPLLTGARRVLEVGSGTGQHAVYFAKHLPHLLWHTSELPQHHAGIHRWLDEAGMPNLRPPVELDVNALPWKTPGPIDAVFSANTLHIVSWSSVENFFRGAGQVLQVGGLLLVYGPFNFGGRFTSDSNARFDQWLKSRDPLSGIRNFEDLCQLAEDNGLEFQQDIEMPANNRVLVWRKR